MWTEGISICSVGQRYTIYTVVIMTIIRIYMLGGLIGTTIGYCSALMLRYVGVITTAVGRGPEEASNIRYLGCAARLAVALG